MSLNVESGENSIYPVMHDIPRERISFIRKVYSIFTFQLLLTIAVFSVVVFVRPVANFFNNNTIHGGVLGILTFFAFCSLCYYHEKHPLSYFLLLIFTVSISLCVGLICALIDGALDGGKIIILEVVALTTVVVISLSLYTFWAAKRGRDFSFLGPYLFLAVLMIFFVGLIQILLFSFGKLSLMIYGCLIFIISYGYIVYMTNKLIKGFSYADYIWVSTFLYLYVINAFFYQLSSFAIAKLIKKDKI